MSLSCNLFINQDAYEKNKSAFQSSREEWSQKRVLAMKFAILGLVFFS